MAIKTPSFSDNKSGNSFLIGRVKSIVMEESDPDYNSEMDLGTIQYEMLYSAKSLPNDKPITAPAKPIFRFIRQYPVIGEIVLIFAGPSNRMNDNKYEVDYYYFPAYSLWGSINHNSFPNLEEYLEFLKKYYSNPQYQYDEKKSLPKMPLGYFFQESNIRSLKLFEGDTAFEGRFGQSIRFGSTNIGNKGDNFWSQEGINGAPITIIRNGQGKIPYISKKLKRARTYWDPITEDLNYDDSSIYLTSGQTIVIEDLTNFPLSSFGTSIGIQVNSTVINLDKAPISNDVSSARDQDEQAINQ